MDVSIIIPTKNGGELFEQVLKKIFEQKTRYEYEVICVDSGSSDNTIEIIKNFHVDCIRYCQKNLGMEKQETMERQREQGNLLYLSHRMRFRLMSIGLKILLMQ